MGGRRLVGWRRRARPRGWPASAWLQPVSARPPLDNVWVRVREIDILLHVVEKLGACPVGTLLDRWRDISSSTGSCTTSTYTSRRAWGATLALETSRTRCRRMWTWGTCRP